MNQPNRAEESARRLLDELDIDDAPVPVEELAIALGVELSFEPYQGDISGVLYRYGNRTVIGVNSAHSPTRQRFTVAHELGHLRLHSGRPVIVDRFVRVNWRDGEMNSDEVEANQFAAELLIPRHLLQQGLNQRQEESDSGTFNTDELIRDLARQFDVSAQAMEFRLASLGVLAPMPILD